MDPVSIIGLVASVAQLVHLTAHTSKLLVTACDRLQNAPESVRDTQRYVERLGNILGVIAKRRPRLDGPLTRQTDLGLKIMIDGNREVADTVEVVDPMDEYLRPLLSQVKGDLEELGREVEKLVAVFAEDSTATTGAGARRKGIDAADIISASAAGIPTSTVGKPTCTSISTKTAAKMFKNAYDRSKGRVKAYYKDDKIRALKSKIEGHIHVFTFAFSAEAL